MATLLSTPLWVQPTSKSIHKYRTRIHASSQSSLLFETSVAATEQTTTSQSQTLDFSPGIMDIPWIHWISPNCQPTKPRPNSIEKIREGYASLRRRQMEAETEAWDEALEEYKELERKMLDKKLAPSLPYVKSLCLSWFEQLKDAIEQDKEDQKKKQSRNSHAIYMGLLPADKLAVILMTKVMEILMPRKSDSVPLTQVALRVGEAIEQEYKIQTFMEKARKSNKNRNEEEELEEISLLEMKIAGKPARHVSGIKKLLRMKKIEIESWPKPAQVQLACRLIEILIETAYVPVPQAESSERLFEMRPAFRHNQLQAAHYEGKFKYRHGVLECDPLIYEHFDSSSVRHMMIPYLPMLVHPLTWKGYNEGAYFYLPSYFMRTHGSKDQREMLRRTPKKQLEKVFEALDALGSTKWRINRRILDIVDNLWDNGGGIAGLVTRQDVPLPEKPKTDDEAEIKKWRWLRRKARKANSEMHALRCDTEIILSVARKMKEEEGFYYPHNLDFRGRAYPMHSHLIHLGSDLCRGILEFCEGKPLGKSGLRWLKIHLANVYGGGIEKLSYDMRLNFAELHLKEIFDSASDPIHGERWWMKGEDPFQCLATCIELAGALKSVFPHTYVSHIPIHQDGSCNGLQHYSALGKFAPEAKAVNLVAGDKPADVYTGVALRVMEKMKEDSKRDPEKFSSASLAKILVNEVDRKLVKQTVMTSVYGVTFIGARAQIKKRLQEKGFIDDDRLLFKASCYASKVTLEALGEMFQAARAIMSWLAECAKIISSVNEPVKWTTPLGLPVVQPYRNQKSVNIVTSLQQMSLKKDGDKVSARQQRQAFPPNFVHSLDGSHMMMTATACRRQGLTFAGVHDSFWTHACDVDTMNRILREKFVELYNIPILENLLESFETSFPELVFPPLPETGDFDIRQVLNSPYFFN